jgi:hypothetical protein
VLHNVGFGAPQNFDGMTRQGTNPHLDDNYNTGPAYLQVMNRFKALVQTGGAQNVFTHNERFGAADALGGNASHFYQMLDQAKLLEFSDGLQNIHCSDTRTVLDAEVFW